jgi:hypothetical protein
MKIITDVDEMDQALDVVGNVLESSYGLPQERDWRFPDGSVGAFPTWILGNKGLVIGFSTERRMNSGRPIVLALRQAASAFTPIVEINIPPQANRSVQGCFAFDEHKQLWLCHRGSRLTVQAYQRKRLSKRMIHTYFRNWLVPSREQNGTASDREAYIIRVTTLPEKNIQRNLQSFAERVEKLKRAWVEHEGDDKKMMRFVLKNPA